MAARGCNSTHGAFYCHGLCQKTRASLRTYTKALRRKHRHGVQAAGAIDLPPLSRVQARLVGSAECGAVAQVLDSLVVLFRTGRTRQYVINVNIDDGRRGVVLVRGTARFAAMASCAPGRNELCLFGELRQMEPE